MRRQVSRVALTAVIVSLLLLAVPFAIGIRISFFSDEATELERAALAAAIQVGPDFTAGDPVELPAGLTDGRVAVYDDSAQLRAGAGPAGIDSVSRAAMAGKVVQGRSDGDLVVAVPVVAAERVIGVVRASSSVSGIWTRVLLAWLGIAGLASVALLVGSTVAIRQAGRLTRPLESLADVARSVTAGDLTARAATSGIPEIDAASSAQNAMVSRLSAVLDHARHFGADAAHQLRTPLAGLRLSLETALQEPDPRESLQDALDRTDDLQLTVEQVLALSRLTAEPPTADQLGTVDDLIDAARRRWHAPLAAAGRRLDAAVTHAVAALPVPLNPIRQVLDILLDNARTHGHGTVSITARDAFDAVAIEISDEGHLDDTGPDPFHRGVTTHPGSGIGLALARNLAESQGARLTITSSGPTVFTLILPTHPGRSGRPQQQPATRMASA